MSLRFTVDQAREKGWISEPPACASPNKKRRRADREGDAQRELITQFDLRWPDLSGRLFHIANGGYRTRLERWLMKAQGVRRGVPDLMLPVPVAPYAGLFIEFKAEPPHDAPLTPEQREWLAWLRAAGYRAERACGCQQALELIESYLASARGVSG